ncbi:hypothetical protein C8J56DRAFT_350755 [Mycena floridula]|nr:hypothetical protein C8J56DRAFT_350755 [Mycena floridula]
MVFPLPPEIIDDIFMRYVLLDYEQMEEQDDHDCFEVCGAREEYSTDDSDSEAEAEISETEVVQLQAEASDAQPDSSAYTDRLRAIITDISVSAEPYDDSDSDDVESLVSNALYSSTRRGSPWTLVQVCGQWRSIALSSPQLWAFIFINLDSFAPRPSSVQLAKQLELSGKSPLTIQFFSTFENPESNGQYSLVPLFLPLLGVTEQWEDVWFHLRQAKMNQLVENTKWSSFSCLKRLVLQTWDHGGWTEKFFVVADWLPWNQLTYLDIDFHVDAIYTPLKLASSLQTCLLRVSSEEPSIPTPYTGPIFELPTLQYLTILGERRGTPGHGVISFLERFKAPTLQLLKVNVKSQGPTFAITGNSIHAVVDFARRSPLLRTLSLGGTLVLDKTVLEILIPVIPSIEDLAVAVQTNQDISFLNFRDGKLADGLEKARSLKLLVRDAEIYQALTMVEDCWKSTSTGPCSASLDLVLDSPHPHIQHGIPVDFSSIHSRLRALHNNGLNTSLWIHTKCLEWYSVHPVDGFMPLLRTVPFQI